MKSTPLQVSSATYRTRRGGGGPAGGGVGLRALTPCFPLPLQVAGRHLNPRCPDAVPAWLCHKGELWTPFAAPCAVCKRKRRRIIFFQGEGRCFSPSRWLRTWEAQAGLRSRHGRFSARPQDRAQRQEAWLSVEGFEACAGFRGLGGEKQVAGASAASDQPLSSLPGGSLRAAASGDPQQGSARVSAQS